MYSILSLELLYLEFETDEDSPSDAITTTEKMLFIMPQDIHAG